MKKPPLLHQFPMNEPKHGSQFLRKAVAVPANLPISREENFLPKSNAHRPNHIFQWNKSNNKIIHRQQQHGEKHQWQHFLNEKECPWQMQQIWQEIHHANSHVQILPPSHKKNGNEIWRRNSKNNKNVIMR